MSDPKRMRKTQQRNVNPEYMQELSVVDDTYDHSQYYYNKNDNISLDLDASGNMGPMMTPNINNMQSMPQEDVINANFPRHSRYANTVSTNAMHSNVNMQGPTYSSILANSLPKQIPNTASSSSSSSSSVAAAATTTSGSMMNSRGMMHGQGNAIASNYASAAANANMQVRSQNRPQGNVMLGQQQQHQSNPISAASMRGPLNLQQQGTALAMGLSGQQQQQQQPLSNGSNNNFVMMGKSSSATASSSGVPTPSQVYHQQQYAHMIPRNITNQQSHHTLPDQNTLGLYAAAAANTSSSNSSSSSSPSLPTPSSSQLNTQHIQQFLSGTNENSSNTVDNTSGSNAASSNSTNQKTPSEHRFGLLGLLSVIKMVDQDLNTLALGLDLTNLGLNLNSTDYLYTSFASPWNDDQSRVVPEFRIPPCYLLQQQVPLKNAHFQKFQDETLFYIFYSMPRDVLQIVAAKELSTRNWKYHKSMKIWFKKQDTDATPPQQQNQQPPSIETGPFIYFDVNTWSKAITKHDFALKADEIASM